MIITDVKKTKKGRYALMVDGEFLFSVHKDTFLTTNLTAGMEFAPRQLEELRVLDERHSAVQSALDVLSRTAQSSGMLYEKLLRYYSQEAALLAIQRMEELGLLDDLDYGMRLSRDMINLRGYSLRRVRQGLLQKKLSAQIIDEVMEQFEEHDEADPIISLILKKYKDKIFDKDGLHKTIAALQRRGFGYDDIKAALGRIEEEELYLDP